MRCPGALVPWHASAFIRLPGVFHGVRPSVHRRQAARPSASCTRVRLLRHSQSVECRQARYLQGLGFKALATTSSGHAHSQGYADGDVSHSTTCWRIIGEIAEATDVPLNADFENGFAARSGRRCRERDALHRDRRRRAVDRGFHRRRRRSRSTISTWRSSASRRRAPPSTRPAATWCSPRAPKASSRTGPTSTRPSGGSRPSPTPAPIASTRRASRRASRSRRP